MHEFEFKELEEATESFSQSRLIGKGSHGYVYKGILEDGQSIAVKKQSLGLQKLQDNSKLENEVQVLSSLAQNPHVINLVGISHDFAKNQVLVMEYMPNGTLHQLLHVASNPPTWPKRVQIAIQVAKAVQFLHEAEPSIIHRDIKSANILFDSEWNARLADFGLAIRMVDDSLNGQVDSLNRPAGTIGYLDPGYTVPSNLSTRTDVFSFGVLLLEIISGSKVIDVSRSPSSIVEWAIPLFEKHQASEICDERVQVSRYMESTINNMLDIASRCVAAQEENRPSMKEIVMELETCIIEPVRFPVWMNLLQSLVLLKRQRKVNGTAKKDNTTASPAATIICEAPEAANGHVDMSRGKLLLREILADIS